MPNRQRNGYGQEAIHTILNYGYETLGLDSFELFVLKNNQRAVSCYQKVGFEIDSDGYTENDFPMRHTR